MTEFSVFPTEYTLFEKLAYYHPHSFSVATIFSLFGAIGYSLSILGVTLSNTITGFMVLLTRITALIAVAGFVSKISIEYTYRADLSKIIVLSAILLTFIQMVFLFLYSVDIAELGWEVFGFLGPLIAIITFVTFGYYILKTKNISHGIGYALFVNALLVTFFIIWNYVFNVNGAFLGLIHMSILVVLYAYIAKLTK